MLVKDLKKGKKYYSRSHQLVMEYCGAQYFQGYKYHNFFEPTWKMFYWLDPRDVRLPTKKEMRPQS